MTSKLSNICFYAKGKVAVKSLTKANYISTENMLPNRGGVVNATTLPTIEDTQGYCVGDVLVSNIRPYFKKIRFADSNGGCSNDVLVFRAKDGVDARYLYYVLADDSFFNYSNATSKGTKMPRGDKSAIMDYIIEEHSLIEQHRIADILSALDKKIANNNAINDNLQQQAQALFDEMFASQDNFESTTLGSVTNNIRDRIGTRCSTVLSAVNSGKLQPSDEYFTKRVYSKDTSNYIMVNEGDFAYNPARINIGSIGINDLDVLGCVSPVYVVFSVDADYQSFFEFYFKSAIFRAETMLRASGSVRQSLNYNDFALITLLYPDRKTAQKFNALWLGYKATIKRLEQENKQLAELRDTLLPKLMSGEIDVSDVEI